MHNLVCVCVFAWAVNVACAAKGLEIVASRAMNKQKLITVILNLISSRSPWGLFSGIIFPTSLKPFILFCFCFTAECSQGPEHTRSLTGWEKVGDGFWELQTQEHFIFWPFSGEGDSHRTDLRCHFGKETIGKWCCGGCRWVGTLGAAGLCFLGKWVGEALLWLRCSC